MPNISIAVPNELQDEIDQWQNGGEYHITVKQIAPNSFQLTSVDDEEPVDTESDDSEAAEMKTGSVNDTQGTTIPRQNPAIVALIASKKSKKS